MPKTPKFRPTKIPKGWRLNIPKTVSASGRREQYFFKSRDEANEARARFLEKYQAHGAAAAIINPGLAEAAVRAAEILEPWGVGLVEVASRFAADMERQQASRPLAQACQEWLEARKQELRPHTLSNYGAMARKLTEALGERILATLTTDDLQAVIAPPGTPPTTARGNKTITRAFWLWSAKKGWCQAEILKGVEVPRETSSGEIGILTVDEAARLLEAAERFYPQAVPMFAVQLFAGVRAEETRRLKPENFTEAGIELGAEITKKGLRRNISLNPTLAAWLKAHPFQKCTDWPRTLAAVKHLAGFKTWVAPRVLKVLPDPLASPPTPWKQNCLRHSHASYAVAAGTPLEGLLFEFGHSGNPSILRRHYVGRTSKREALEYFSLRPRGQREASKPQIVKSA